MEINNPRTRFAPSPTGMLHLGNANTALFNWLLARHYGGTVVLRIEDTDRERSKEEYEAGIIDDLKWLGIDWDEGPDTGGDFGPYRQNERGDLYNKYMEQLIEQGSVFRCYCTKEELDAEREKAKDEKRDLVYNGKCKDLTPADWEKLDAEGKPYTIRFRKPVGEEVSFDDLVRGTITKSSDELDDFILVRSNGLSTFLMANAIDDALMKITHVVRGEDHITNTIYQILLLRALGMNVPQYLHTSMILGKDRSKLSKRHGATSVRQFRDDGYLPEAMVNYLAFLGWNPKDNREFFALSELVDVFSVENMSKSQAVFDYKRIKFMNNKWMMKIDSARVADMCIPVLQQKGWVGESEEDIAHARRLIEIFGDRIKKPEDVETQADYFFEDFESYEEENVNEIFAGPETGEMLNMLREKMAAWDDYAEKGLETLYKGILDETGMKFKEIVHPLRLALSGRTTGPGIFELMEVLGKEKCVERLALAVDWIKRNKRLRGMV